MAQLHLYGAFYKVFFLKQEGIKVGRETSISIVHTYILTYTTTTRVLQKTTKQSSLKKLSQSCV